MIPQLENAILSGQDIILLGERGQAKSRLIRALVSLLDEEVPIVAGSEINDNPFEPISKHARDLIAEKGDATPIDWVERDRRYGEKLATPDITIADLIGEVDPIKVAEGRYLSDELTIHYGLIPRTNRGIFAINELPDLAERIQVGLFNIMEERDIQIRGYQIRLALDVFLVSSANPEDYTNRGRIITPLKDRYGVQIRTHYPRQVEHEIGIMEQERMRFDDDDYKVVVPQYMKEIVAEISRLARRSPDVNQRSGVSVRASIANYESLLANAHAPRDQDQGERGGAARQRPALRHPGDPGQGRVRDRGRRQGRADPREADPGRRLLAVFNRYFSVSDFDEVVTRFKSGISVEVGDMMPSDNYAAHRQAGRGARQAGGEGRGEAARLRSPPSSSSSSRGCTSTSVSTKTRLGRRSSTGANSASPRRSPHGHAISLHANGTARRRYPPLDPDDILNALTDDLMNFGDLQHALRNLLQRGMRNPMGDRTQGLRDLLQQLRQQRRQTLDQFNLSSAFEDIQKRLEEILDKERSTLDERLERRASRASRTQDGQPRTVRTARAASEGSEGQEGQQGQQSGARQSGSAASRAAGPARPVRASSRRAAWPAAGRPARSAGWPTGPAGRPARPVGRSRRWPAEEDRKQFAEMLKNIVERKRNFLEACRRTSAAR